MANYSNLKAAIAAAIKTNGNQEITGQVLQDVLNSIVSVIGANYTFTGVATPATNPGTPDQNVVYMASQAGTYTNFSGIELPAGISLLMWNGAWTTQTFFVLDDAPTAGSDNLVKSGGVYAKLSLIPKESYNGYINFSSQWKDLGVPGRSYKIINIDGVEGDIHVKCSQYGQSIIAFLSEYNPVEGTNNGIIGSMIPFSLNDEATLQIPTGTKYIYVLWLSGTERAPEILEINGMDLYSDQIGLEVLKRTQKTDKSDILNDLPIESKTVREEDMELNASILALRNGEITNVLHFVNGCTISGRSKMSYGDATRLVSDRIDSCSNGTINVLNNSSSPQLKIMVSTVNTEGKFATFIRWTTAGFSFDISLAPVFYIMLAKTDDSALTPSDINGLTIINTIPNEINGTSIFDFNPQNELLSKLLNIKRGTVEYGGSTTEYPPVLSFIHFSDIHADNNNLARLKQFYEKYKNDYINFVIQTGDLIGGSFSEGMPSEYAETTDFLNVIGNHDSANRVGTPPNHHWEIVDQKSVYDVVIAPYVSGWGVIQPNGANENGYCYFYKDFLVQKVRIIIIDCMHWDVLQNTWLNETLESARQNALHVVIATHYPPFLCEQDIEKNTFTSIQINSASAGLLNGNAADSVENFISLGGKFVCWICGHIHQDISGFGLVDDGYEKQFMFSIASESVAPSVNYSEMGRANGTKTQDCFNIVGIDTQSGLLKIVRIGANNDRYLRRREVLCVDYINSRIIYCG